MKQETASALAIAVERFLASVGNDQATLPAIELERTRDERHGDFASNVAMMLAREVKLPPRQVAEAILSHLPAVTGLARTEIAGPGFINFHFDASAHLLIIPAILEAGSAYGRSTMGTNRKVLLEFVSCNPTGPVHVGHGRGASYGSVLASLLTLTGHQVTREYYVNDAGRQMDILTISVWLRYLALQQPGHGIPFPSNAYHGAYIIDIARQLQADYPDLPGPDSGELHAIINGHAEEDRKLDLLIELARQTLGNNSYRVILDLALKNILDDIRDDLAGFGVQFDNWFSERTLIESGEVARCIARLEASGDIYEKEGALWFASTRYGDEKDRVVVRENGQATYFASDIAYHLNKYERGFDEIINIWGADHHGYISRVKGALSALGQDPDRLKILLVQFATLYKGEEKLQMSTRSGEFVTLRELREEVGDGATRFFYVTRKSEQHLDFDLELAKSESNANPVYYIQYAHARICSVFRQLEERGLAFTPTTELAALSLLQEPPEQALVRTLARYGETVEQAARGYDAHLLAYYLRELANDLHGYYNNCQFLVDDDNLRQARLSLIMATRQVIRNGLSVLGVSAPEEM